jgi:glycyl-tRNA synthetase beta chain
MSNKPLLIEIGVEEIPAGVAPHMGDALKLATETLLSDAKLQVSELKLGVTPRRLLIHALECPVMQENREETIWGPPEKVAFKDGQPTKAAEGFAKKSGLNVTDFELADKGDDKGNYMKAVQTVKGRNVADIIAEAMPAILRKLPSPKQMKWNDGNNRDDAFIRPVRWIVARLGDEVIPFSFAGVESGKISHGHRVHGSTGEMGANDPFGWLEKQYVMADRDARKHEIGTQLANAMNVTNVELIEDRDLLEEVADLTEWPQVITGRYDKDFLRLPEEVARIELKHHQRCFASKTANGKTSNVFFAIANIQSKDPATVAHGNERVVNARLADAMFYFERDPQESLESRVEKLSEVIFQDGLGMVGDQVHRLRGFVLNKAKVLGIKDDDANDAQRAAYLCKSDLTTGLVGEFPELQGYMGGIYAKIDGENEAVANAIAAHYAPTGADDDLPDNVIARAIGIAERADKLLGYFHLGRVPTASADPFGLRRAAIGLIRLLENAVVPIDMPLTQVLNEAAKQWNQQRVTIAITEETKQAVLDFIYERLLGMNAYTYERRHLDASLHASMERPIYQIIAVAELLADFTDSETGQAVAVANKRIANILKKTGNVSGNVNEALLSEAAEKELFLALKKVEADFPENPEAQLKVLASLREPVDTFFDEVMVMAEDESVRNNRLALLNRLRGLFLKLADISRL